MTCYWLVCPFKRDCTPTPHFCLTRGSPFHLQSALSLPLSLFGRGGWGLFSHPPFSLFLSLSHPFALFPFLPFHWINYSQTLSPQGMPTCLCFAPPAAPVGPAACQRSAKVSHLPCGSLLRTVTLMAFCCPLGSWTTAFYLNHNKR